MKKVISLICVIVIVATLFAVSVSAAHPNELSTTDKIKVALLETAVDLANAKIALCVYYAQWTSANDVSWLLSQVDSTVKNVYAFADALNLKGYSVECDYVLYVVDGQEVYIDPLKVVNL